MLDLASVAADKLLEEDMVVGLALDNREEGHQMLVEEEYLFADPVQCRYTRHRIQEVVPMVQTFCSQIVNCKAKA